MQRLQHLHAGHVPQAACVWRIQQKGGLIHSLQHHDFYGAFADRSTGGHHELDVFKAQHGNVIHEDDMAEDQGLHRREC